MFLGLAVSEAVSEEMACYSSHASTSSTGRFSARTVLCDSYSWVLFSSKSPLCGFDLQVSHDGWRCMSSVCSGTGHLSYLRDSHL